MIVQTIECCQKCPFRDIGPASSLANYDECKLTPVQEGDGSRRYIPWPTEVNGWKNPPPSWCPLRQNPILLTVGDTKVTKLVEHDKLCVNLSDSPTKLGVDNNTIASIAHASHLTLLV